MKKLLISICLFISPLLMLSQETNPSDSLSAENLRFSKKQLIIPGLFFTYGIASIESDFLQMINTDIRDEVKENIDEKFTIDDFSVFLPVLSVYGLNASGIKGHNNLKNRTLIMGASAFVLSTTVLGLKALTHIERPDESSDNSFPSGHTATAFAGAEFLYQEYKHVSPWIGLAGYAVATGTGFFRIYNNRHWLSDVMMGAGIGILSTKIAYWTFPYFQRPNTRDPQNISSHVLPYFNGKQTGLALVFTIR